MNQGLLTNINSLLRMPADGGPGEVDEVNDAALAWSGGRILFAGPEKELPTDLGELPEFDAGGRLVIPGLIDCHTHLCFGGWRGDEFADRLAGKSYQEIAADGGGIKRTVAATREAGEDELFDKAAAHMQEMTRLGVTTVEAKSGYGLERAAELKQLEVYRRLCIHQPLTIVPTFLGAHLVPPEYAHRRGAYVDLLCKELIPLIAGEGLARFCDVFVEQGAFTLDEARRILETAREHGLGLKVHADQLSAGGGAQLAAELGAVSAEHLEYADDAGLEALAEAGTVAVSLPIASLYLKERYLPARRFIDAGVRVAVATDFNPGSAPSFHIHLALVLACLNQGMTPAEAVQAATTHAARALGKGGQIGTLNRGLPADIAVIDTPDINHWLYHFRPNACVGTLKDGHWLYREF